MTILKQMERLEENHLKGYIEPSDSLFDDECEDEDSSRIDDFARKIMVLVFGILFDSSSFHLFQLKREEFIPMSSWSQESILDAIYLSLTQQNGNVYLYLEDQNSLIVLDDSMACPLYSENQEWLEKLKVLLIEQELVIRN